jgi:hypothetical protein
MVEAAIQQREVRSNVLCKKTPAVIASLLCLQFNILRSETFNVVTLILLSLAKDLHKMLRVQPIIFGNVNLNLVYSYYSRKQDLTTDTSVV